MNKPCKVCGKPATHKIVKIVDGELDEQYLCEEHAAGSGSFLAQSNLQLNLEELLSALLSKTVQSQGQSQAPAPEDDIKCGVCGLPFSLYRKTMILGCDRCYESFEDRLEPDLRKFHGATRHTGRKPAGFVAPTSRVQAEPVHPPSALSEAAAKPEPAKPQEAAQSPQERLSELQKRMSEAVQSEDFEQAARLRDEIKGLKEETGG